MKMKIAILRLIKGPPFPRFFTVPGLVLALYAMAALAAPILANQNPYDPLQIFAWDASLPPGTPANAGYIYILGTDGLGRDILSAIFYGLRISLVVSLTSVAIAAVIGLSAGVTAAYAGGWLDIALMRLVDLQLSLPTMLVALIAIVTLGPGIDRIVLALVIAQWATYARVVRASALSEIAKPYVDAARLLKLPLGRILLRHVLPNSVAPAITLLPIDIGHAIALEATLSFLGLGVPIDRPSLGSLVANGFQYLMTGQYWISLFPGLALFGLIASINLVGEAIRQRMDPRSLRS
jgi:peptide/nickel transport system permease protein